MTEDTCEFHIFSCVVCRSQWTVHSTHSLDCFFFGVCYWCAREHDLTHDKVVALIKPGLLKDAPRLAREDRG